MLPALKELFKISAFQFRVTFYTLDGPGSFLFIAALLFGLLDGSLMC